MSTPCRSGKSTIGSGTPSTGGPTGVSGISWRGRWQLAGEFGCSSPLLAGISGCAMLHQLSCLGASTDQGCRAELRCTLPMMQASGTTRPGGAPWARAPRSASAPASVWCASSSTRTANAPAGLVSCWQRAGPGCVMVIRKAELACVMQHANKHTLMLLLLTNTVIMDETLQGTSSTLRSRPRCKCGSQVGASACPASGLTA